MARIHTYLFVALSHAWTLSSASTLTLMVINESGTEQAMPNAAVSVLVKGSRSTAPAGTTAQMAQKGRAFQPRLLLVQTGTAVQFPNFDTVRHHVYSFSNIKKFELKLYAGTPTDPVVFDKAGTATLGCNIHDQMLGYVHVVDTPYFGITNTEGQVDLDLPLGEHKVKIWWPALGEASPGFEKTLKIDSNTHYAIKIKP